MNFSMPMELVRGAFEEAAGGRAGGARMWYHQSLATVTCTPDRDQWLVTCHGPLVVSVERALGREEAVKCFGGGYAKVEALRRLQADGIERLRADPNGLAIEFTRRQVDRLVEVGAPRARCVALKPPIVEPKPGGSVSSLARAWLAAESEAKPFAMTARVDGFKNLREVVLAHVALRERGIKSQLYLAVGGGGEGEARAALLDGLQPSDRASIRIEQAQTPAGLAATFAQAAGATGTVFVMSSCYETLGLTVLEAAAAGVRTLVNAGGGEVGVTEHLPLAQRYEGGATGLSCAIRETVAEGQPFAPGPEFRFEQFVAQLRSIVNHQIGLPPDV